MATPEIKAKLILVQGGGALEGNILSKDKKKTEHSDKLLKDIAYTLKNRVFFPVLFNKSEEKIFRMEQIKGIRATAVILKLLYLKVLAALATLAKSILDSKIGGGGGPAGGPAGGPTTGTPTSLPTPTPTPTPLPVPTPVPTPLPTPTGGRPTALPSPSGGMPKALPTGYPSVFPFPTPSPKTLPTGGTPKYLPEPTVIKDAKFKMLEEGGAKAKGGLFSSLFAKGKNLLKGAGEVAGRVLPIIGAAGLEQVSKFGRFMFPNMMPSAMASSDMGTNGEQGKLVKENVENMDLEKSSRDTLNKNLTDFVVVNKTNTDTINKNVLSTGDIISKLNSQLNSLASAVTSAKNTINAQINSLKTTPTTGNINPNNTNKNNLSSSNTKAKAQAIKR